MKIGKTMKSKITKALKKIVEIDHLLISKKIYQIVCLVLVVAVSLVLIDSFNKVETYSNYAEFQSVGVHMDEGMSVSFTFEAKKSELSSLTIYKDMSRSRLDVSDKIEISLTDELGEEIFSKETFLYHAHRNYIVLDLGHISLDKRGIYTVCITAINLSDQSSLFLKMHSVNTFEMLNDESETYDVPVGFSFVPDVSYHYSVLSLVYLIPHLLLLYAAAILLMFPKLCSNRFFKEMYRAVFIILYLYLSLEILNVAREESLQILFPLTMGRLFTILCGMAILVLIYMLLYFSVGNGSVAMLVVFVLTFVIGYINHSKIVMRGDPFMPWDVFAAGIAAKCSSKFDFRMTKQFFASFILIVIILLMIRLTHSKSIKNWKIRILGFLMSAILAASFMFGIVLNKPFLNSNNISYSIYPPLESFNENGTIFSFVLHLNNISAKGEEDNSPEMTENTIEEYVEVVREMALDDLVQDSQTRPNVICIMSESYGDLRMLRDIDTSEEVMPFFDSLKSDSLFGELQVSIFAGGTCNTEFEFLTGHSVSGLLAGSSVYTFYTKGEVNALPNIFRDEGYKTVAIHPFDEQWWDRNKAYPLLGFDEFISDDDFIDPTYIRSFISDQSAFDRIIDEYEESKGQDPLFAFCVTMQNHADYSRRWDNQNYDIDITNFPDYQFPYTENYLSLLRESDDALKELIEYFDQVDEPTIIVFFGDHLPALDYGLYDTLLDTDICQITAKESLPMYVTPYIIWSNYDLPVGYEGITSPNFLGQTVLDLAGIQSPDERACLRVLQTKISAISALAVFDLDGTPWTDIDSIDDDILKILRDYEFIQYGSIFYTDTEID